MSRSRSPSPVYAPADAEPHTLGEDAVASGMRQLWRDDEKVQLMHMHREYAVAALPHEVGLTNGELVPAAIRLVLRTMREAAPPTRAIRFVDIGSGCGKVVLAVPLAYNVPLEQAVGMELVTSRLAVARTKLDQMKSAWAADPAMTERLACVTFLERNAMREHPDPEPDHKIAVAPRIADFTDVFVFGAAMPPDLIEFILHQVQSPLSKCERFAICFGQRAQYRELRGYHPPTVVRNLKMAKGSSSYTVYVYARIALTPEQRFAQPVPPELLRGARYLARRLLALNAHTGGMNALPLLLGSISGLL